MDIKVMAPASETKLEVSEAKKLLSEVIRFRRMAHSKSSCFPSDCEACMAPHLPKVLDAIRENRKIRFVLPAFPGKSPNKAKVLGVLPDMAEKQALTFLNSLCERIRKHYSPGAEIIICSDGRVFNDVIGILDEDLRAYQRQIGELIEDLGLTNLSTFNLLSVYGGDDHDLLRRNLMSKYGRPLEKLREMVKRGGTEAGSREDRDAHRHYCGTTRFLVEDTSFPGQTKSKNALQKECKAKAYEVMRRSNAWTDLIAEYFPDALRLSIHPQACASKKLGIQLVGASNWMTPWHGVAVDIGSNFVLMKRSQAEELGAKLILDSDARPSHFKLESIEV
jgi:pyoverdine/dityrosine biosynthesis protein Dit1